MGILKTISQGNRSAGGLGLPIVLALAGLPAALAAPGSAWDLEQGAAYVADMSQAEPRGALSSDGRPGTWKVVPFQTSVVSGKMLFASPSPQKPASELRLKAPVRGWHAVYVGMNYPPSLIDRCS